MPQERHVDGDLYVSMVVFEKSMTERQHLHEQNPALAWFWRECWQMSCIWESNNIVEVKSIFFVRAVCHGLRQAMIHVEAMFQ